MIKTIIKQQKNFFKKIIEDDDKPDFTRTGIKKPHFPVSYEKREYQTDAVDNWQKANFRGFFEMATGTGKTITSLRAACRLIDKKDNLFTLILVPSTSLVNQWENDCKLFLFQRVVKVFLVIIKTGTMIFFHLLHPII